MIERVKVSVTQIDIKPLLGQENLKRIPPLMEEASRSGAQAILFP